MSERNRLKCMCLCVLASGLSFGQATATAKATEAKGTAPEKTETLAPIVVMASKTGAVEGSLGQTVDIITSQELELRGSNSVTDILREVSGIDFRQSGPGDLGTASVSIRGMQPRHTKLLIDGIPWHDPSVIGALPMFGGLQLDMMDRIEVVKGSSSLQGSSAVGGLVNLVTKRPAQEGIHGSIGQEFGSHGRSNTSLELLGKHGILDYRFNVGRNRERGISSVYRDGYGSLNLDDDHYRAMTYDGRIGLQLSEHWRFEAFGRFQDIDWEYDNGYTYDDWMTGETVVVPDDDNQWYRRTLGGAMIQGKDLFDGFWDTKLQFALTRSDRVYENVNRYTGDHREVEWSNTLHLDERNDITLGIQYEEDQMRIYGDGKHRDSNEMHRSTSYYAGYQTEPIDGLFINVNGRIIDHCEYGIEWASDASVRYTLESTGTTFKGSIGRGYKTPDMYELYGYLAWSYVGNPDLEPETSFTWDIGFEQELFEKTVKVGSTYFENRVDDYISSVQIPDTFNYTFEQIPGVTIRGLESFVEWKPFQGLGMKLSHTYQFAENEDNGEDYLAYVPRHKVGANITYKCLEDEALTLNLGGVFMGSRWSDNNKANRVKVDDYLLLHAAAKYKITKSVSVLFRIDNLLNTRYFDMYSYGTWYSTYGRTYYVGVKYTF